MDRATIQYYEENAEALFARYQDAQGGISKLSFANIPTAMQTTSPTPRGLNEMSALRRR